MNRLLLGSVALSVVMVSYGATTAQWKIDTSATAAETTFDGAAAWFDVNNWESGFVPEGAEDVAQFYKSGGNWDSSGLRYTSVDRDFTIGGITRSYNNSRYRDTWDANKRVLLLDEHTLTVANDAANPYLYGLNIYGKTVFESAKGNIYVAHVDFCGPVENRTGKLLQMRQMTRETAFRFRRDKWADSTATEISNLGPTEYNFDGGGFVAFVAPHGSDGVTGFWDTAEGSALIRLSSDAEPHVLSAGATVTGAGIPEGTFVKRIYTDSIVELSQAATATATGVELSFGAFRSKLYQRIDGWTSVAHTATYQIGFRPFKYRAEDECVVEIMDAKKPGKDDGTYHLLFDTDEYHPEMLPGRVIFHNTSAYTRNLTLGNCEVEFAATTNGTPVGFPNRVMMNGADRVARVIVGEGLSATFGTLTNVIGTLVKTGAGSLTSPLDASAFATGADRGGLVVEEGTLELASTPDAELEFACLAVTNGATLRFPDCDVRCHALPLEPGARIEFNGRLFVPLDAVIPDGVLSDGITVVRPVPEVDCAPSDSYLRSIEAEAKVVGNPARWFDASDRDSIIFADPEQGFVPHDDYKSFKNYPFVLSWLDHRGASYGSATCHWASATQARAHPLLTNSQGRAEHIFITQCSSTTPTSRNDLEWEKRTTGIRSVFKVMNTSCGGGTLIGSSSYGRGLKRSYEYGEPLFYNVPPAWTNTPFYVNGEARDWRRGYPYRRGTSTSIEMHQPMVVEFHAPDDTWYGQNFGYQGKNDGGNGDQMIYECLIYTNVLTETERLSVRKYLMQKWCPEADVPNHSTELDGFDHALSVGDGTHVEIQSEKAVYSAVSGAGQIGKHGAGALQLEEIDGNDLAVVEGKLSLRSVPVPTAADVGVPYVHVDASDDASFTEMSGTTVRGWRDTRGAGYLTATAVATAKGPALVLDETLGKNVVDFGAAAQSKNTSLAANTTALAYQFTSNAHTVVQLINTEKGGGAAFFGHPEYGMVFNADRLLHGGFYRANFQAKTGFPISDPSFPMIDGGSYYSSAAYFAAGCTNGVPGGMWARQNGSYVEPKYTGFRGEWELVSFVDPEPVLAGGFAQMPYSNKDYSIYGGFKIAESLVYTNVLTRAEVKRVEAYLRYKWYGETTPGERPAVAGALSVSEDAELEVWGGAPLSVSAMSVAGTVSGALALREGGVIEVVVKEDGTVDPLAISDGVTLPATGTVKLVGAVGNLVKGAYPLFETDATGLGDGWTVDLGGATAKGGLALHVIDGQLVLDVTPLGMLLIVR